MNIEEMYNEMRPSEFVYSGKLPDNLECLHCSNEIVEISEEQKQELAILLAKHDAIALKLDKLSKDWRSKWFLK